MNKNYIIIGLSVVGVAILAYVIYSQAVKKKKRIIDTNTIYNQSLTQTATVAPTQTGTPGSGVLLTEYQNEILNQNFPIMSEVQPGGGVLLPEYQNSGLGFMPGSLLTTN